MIITCDKDMDTVLLIMQVEDCFGICIPDEEAEKIRNVGDLFSYVRERVSAGTSNECLTAKTFYRLRRSLMHLTGRQRSSIRVDTSLDELLPKADRQQKWTELHSDLSLELPKLMRPTFVYNILPILAVPSFIAGFIGIFVEQYWLLFVWPLCAIIIVLMFRFTRHMAVHLPGCHTVGDLSRCVWTKNSKSIAEKGASDQQIWEAIVNILTETVGMHSSQVTRELSFADVEGVL